jgi:hypothetical protein
VAEKNKESEHDEGCDEIAPRQLAPGENAVFVKIHTLVHVGPSACPIQDLAISFWRH